jgi:hypothetical protein
VAVPKEAEVLARLWYWVYKDNKRLMNWANLKEMNCPSCASKLKDAPIGYRCTNETCDFRIGFEKFRQVVNNLYSGKKDRIYNPDSVDRSDWD